MPLSIWPCQPEPHTRWLGTVLCTRFHWNYSNSPFPSLSTCPACSFLQKQQKRPLLSPAPCSSLLALPPQDLPCGMACSLLPNLWGHQAVFMTIISWAVGTHIWVTKLTWNTGNTRYYYFLAKWVWWPYSQESKMHLIPFLELFLFHTCSDPRKARQDFLPQQGHSKALLFLKSPSYLLKIILNLVLKAT